MFGRPVRRRLALGVAGLAATLGCAGAANGGSADTFTNSRLEVASTTFAGQTTVGVAVELGDPESGQIAVAAHVDVTMPPGYTLNLGDPAGTKVGGFGAIAAPANGAGDVDLLFGDVAVEDPAVYAVDPVAQACAPGPHAAYWQGALESVLSQGSKLAVPIAVDTTQTADGKTAYTFRFCPLVAPTADAPSARALVTSFLSFSRATAPSTPATYQWSALVTPATAALAPDPASAFELRGDVPVPQTLTLHARYVSHDHAVVLTGRLLAEGKPRGGVSVSIGSDGDLGGAGIVTTTRPNGSFAAQEYIAKTQQFAASVDTVLGSCTAPSTAPGGCRGESLAGAASTTAVLVLPRRTDPKMAPKPHDQTVARRSVVTAVDLPGSHLVGDAPPPCEAFAPNVHRLTKTGDQRSSLFLTADQNAEVYTTASVFGTAADAKADLAALGQIAGTRCEAADEAGLSAHIASLRKLALPTIGDEVRGFRATVVGDGLAPLTVDVLDVRVARVVITMHVLSIASPNSFELSLARRLAARAH